jgi:hypothetical protein
VFWQRTAFWQEVFPNWSCKFAIGVKSSKIHDIPADRTFLSGRFINTQFQQ